MQPKLRKILIDDDKKFLEANPRITGLKAQDILGVTAQSINDYRKRIRRNVILDNRCLITGFKTVRH